MTVQIGQIQETPAAPRVETVSTITYGFVCFDVPGAGFAYVDKGTDVFCTSHDWCIGARDEFSFNLFTEHVDGMALEVLLSNDGLNFYTYHVFTIPGVDMTFMGGMILPGFMAQFVLHNNNVAVQGVDGLFMLRGR